MIGKAFFLALSFPLLIWGRGLDETAEGTGNLAVSLSQQVAPLISFGQNIINQGDTQIYLFGTAFIGSNSYTTILLPSLLYGIRDDFSFYFSTPVFTRNKDGENHSSGLADIFLQLEYAFYMKNAPDFSNKATIVANVTFPAGSSSVIPSTGFGSYSYFLGSTFAHTGTNWFLFVSPGVIFTTSKNGSRTGDQLLYQCGAGRNILSSPGWVFAWEVEFDGIYSWKNRVDGVIDPNSGGNVAYLTPSLWASSERWIFQLGAGYPVIQHLFGSQERKYLLLAFDVGVSF